MTVSEKIKGNRGKGFGGASAQSTPPDAQTAPVPGAGGTSQALALAGGLGNAAAQQGQALTELAAQTERGVNVMADHFAGFFNSVADGSLLMAKIAERMQPAANLHTEITVPVPELPQLPTASITADFFQTPQPIALPKAK